MSDRRDFRAMTTVDNFSQEMPGDSCMGEAERGGQGQRDGESRVLINRLPERMQAGNVSEFIPKIPDKQAYENFVISLLYVFTIIETILYNEHST